MKIHVFATMMALYPITKTEEIADEFGISVSRLQVSLAPSVTTRYVSQFALRRARRRERLISTPEAPLTPTMIRIIYLISC